LEIRSVRLCAAPVLRGRLVRRAARWLANGPWPVGQLDTPVPTRRDSQWRCTKRTGRAWPIGSKLQAIRLQVMRGLMRPQECPLTMQFSNAPAGFQNAVPSEACAWCPLMAIRGPVFTTAAKAIEGHDSCDRRTRTRRNDIHHAWPLRQVIGDRVRSGDQDRSGTVATSRRCTSRTWPPCGAHQGKRPATARSSGVGHRQRVPLRPGLPAPHR
jgi:hypothetical protein